MAVIRTDAALDLAPGLSAVPSEIWSTWDREDQPHRYWVALGVRDSKRRGKQGPTGMDET